MTPEQNKYYRSKVVRGIALALNKDEDDVSQFLKGKFMSTKYLNEKDATKYITDCEVWAAEMGVIL